MSILPGNCLTSISYFRRSTCTCFVWQNSLFKSDGILLAQISRHPSWVASSSDWQYGTESGGIDRQLEQLGFSQLSNFSLIHGPLRWIVFLFFFAQHVDSQPTLCWRPQYANRRKWCLDSVFLYLWETFPSLPSTGETSRLVTCRSDTCCTSSLSKVRLPH